MACVAFPTCGLAMAESERYLPSLISKIEDLLDEAGVNDEEITIRMTGCPNGCARPALAEIAFIGKAPGKYNMYLGGGFKGERLNKLYKENIGEQEYLKVYVQFLWIMVKNVLKVSILVTLSYVQVLLLKFMEDKTSIVKV